MQKQILKFTTGFTLVELLLVLSIGAILVTVAVPSFSSLFKNGRVTTQTNSFVSDVNFARTEAIKRGVPIVICRSANPVALAPVCGGGTNSQWTTGWLVFASGDGNTSYDAGVDTILRIKTEARGNVSIKSNNNFATTLIYNPDGMLNGGNTALFAVCDERGVSQGNQLQISPTGRPQLVSPVPVSCTTPSV